MTMLVVSFGAGLVFGIIFFGGLWWTVVRGVSFRRTKMLFIISFLVRAGMVILALSYIAGGDPIRIGCYMLGFLTARTVVMRRFQPPREGERVQDESYS
ncbi:MAG TPA: ATP synthase subunit I [Methylomusa anaerophila]|uniref:N-ATPase, AtpR subunit n=1 Tax=Methylomusa anaerophila TaxID=1930071 RepID=A0A348ALB6_9FIRM|nr:ATP synthase subunit I [Methylomusa anaerophila]BBB91864.1 N-ATPase, AtpR subunit [Methylomusa anaerophila]HML88405.1 ATP synthase subunit I [Methylomusa anaerophila]